jgi:hypothetical protein
MAEKPPVIIYEPEDYDPDDLPPVDWDMVARSREAFKRGEGEPIEDLIRRLGGTPAKENPDAP